MERMLEWNEPKINGIYIIYSQEETGEDVLTAFPKRTPSQMVSLKIVKFYRKSFLQNTAVRLPLISCNILNVSLALSPINQFSHI